MKTIAQTKIVMLLLLGITLFSCKKNENTTMDSQGNSVDSTEMTVDTVGPESDSTTANGAGTTGATGEGSTGSGTAGSTQKGAVNVKKDSVK